MKVKKAIIPAAGLGTRFLPATKAQPKEMLPVVDKPTIQYIIEEAIASGIEDIIIVTGRNKRAIEDHFDYSIELENELREKKKDSLLKMVRQISDMVDIHYVRQKKPNGLGDAVLHARKFIHDEPFAVLLGDNIVEHHTPCLKQLIDIYEQTGASVVGVNAVDIQDIHQFGVVSSEREVGDEGLWKISDVVEKPKNNPPSNLAIMGRYIFTPELFRCLEQTTADESGEIQLTDAIRTLLQKEPAYALRYKGKTYDTGNKLGFLKATVEIALNRSDLGDEFKRYLQSLDLR